VFVFAITCGRIGAIGQRKQGRLDAEKTLVFNLPGRPTRGFIAWSNGYRSKGIGLHVHEEKISGFLAVGVGFKRIGFVFDRNQQAHEMD
jgi:hypothetical protein